MARPNILLVTGDHMRHDAVAANASVSPPWSLAHAIETPNLDRLAREGVTFLHSFTPNPICVPARASITTGNYSHTCIDSIDNGGRIGDDQPKLAELFADAGYDTVAVGKLHYVPYAPPGEPRLLHGFRYCELNEEGRAIAQFDPTGKTPGIEDYHDYLVSVGWGGYERAHGVGNNDVHPAPSPVPEEHHEEAWVASRSIAALERHAEERPDAPFLLWSSFSKPHSPYDPPRPWDAKYDPRDLPAPAGVWGDEEMVRGRDPDLVARRTAYGWDRLSPEAVRVARAHYAAMVSFQDAQIGRILSWLEERDMLDDTVVVYTADHGDLLGDFGRFFKTSMLDGSVRIPFIWRLPAAAGADGRHEREQLVGLQDILPTLCALADVALPCEVHGRDLSDALADADAPGRECYFSETSGPKAMARTREWKYAYSAADATEELYDATDPTGELVNLAQDPAHAETLADMRARLIAWATETGFERILVDGGLVRTDAGDPAPPFRAGSMGWRWY